MMVLGTASYKPRPSLQSNRDPAAGFKTGACVWGKDTWHIQKSGVKTLCGIDCSEWMRLGQIEIDHHLCSRCEKIYRKKQPPTQTEAQEESDGN